MPVIRSSWRSCDWGSGTCMNFAPYPASSTAAISSSGRTVPGFTRTRARSVAKFTEARSTPGSLESLRSIRATQEAQVIPSMSSAISSKTGALTLRASLGMSSHPSLRAVSLDPDPQDQPGPDAVEPRGSYRTDLGC